MLCSPLSPRRFLRTRGTAHRTWHGPLTRESLPSPHAWRRVGLVLIAIAKMIKHRIASGFLAVAGIATVGAAAFRLDRFAVVALTAVPQICLRALRGGPNCPCERPPLAFPRIAGCVSAPPGRKSPPEICHEPQRKLEMGAGRSIRVAHHQRLLGSARAARNMWGPANDAKNVLLIPVSRALGVGDHGHNRTQPNQSIRAGRPGLVLC